MYLGHHKVILRIPKSASFFIALRKLRLIFYATLC